MAASFTAVSLSPVAGQAPSAASPPPEVKLQQALRLPEASLSREAASSLGIGFDDRSGFHMFMGADAAEAPSRLASLRRSLTGTDGDAARYDLIGRYSLSLGQIGQAKQAFLRSESLYRRQMSSGLRAARSGDRERALVGLSRSLDAVGKADEAAATLLRSLRQRPRAWRLWDALGEVQAHQAEAVLTTTGEASADRIRRALRLRDRARASFDCAVSLAPTQGLAWAERGQFRMDEPDFLNHIKRARGLPAPPFSTDLPPSALSDWYQAARLRPDDPYAVAYPVWLEVSYLGFFRLHRPFPGRQAWEAMPDAVRSRAGQAIARLTQLSQGRNRALALRADVALGFLLFETRRATAPAEAALRRALSGPDRRPAAEMLMHIMGLESQDGPLADFCEAQARHRETPRLHMIAACAEARRGLLRQAQADTERALSLEPSNATNLLALAVLTLQQDTGAEARRTAQALLSRAAPLAQEPPLRGEYQATLGICLALDGEFDKARTALKAALRDDARGAEAQQALSLIGEQGTTEKEK